MIEITISPEFRSKWPTTILGCIECDVIISEENNALWEKIDHSCHQIQSALLVEEIAKIPAVNATRKVYRALGKDPARYRPSAEALMRRTIKGYGLYRVNNVVDIVNLVSIETGFSIGGYDLSKINQSATLSIGTENDQYEGIGRGELNIDGLPVLRDQTGAFGSPTSDSERTSVNLNTQHFLMVIFGFGDHSSIPAALNFAESLLKEFASTQQITQFILKG